MAHANLLAAESEVTKPVTIAHRRETSALDLLDLLTEVSDRDELGWLAGVRP